MGFFVSLDDVREYERMQCKRCVHFAGRCPIMQAHWDTEQHTTSKIQRLLDTFIPTDVDGANLECRMFVRREW